MVVLICPDSFKGSLRAGEAAGIISSSLRAIERSIECRELPMADGGEGTGAILAAYMGAKEIRCKVPDPLGRTIVSQYYLSTFNTAIIEMAAASGWELLEAAERDPMKTHSAGTGELIRRAAENGAKKILLAVGGSASNDGGMGMAHALGARFLDTGGHELAPCGANLSRIRTIDTTLLVDVPDIEILHDVVNPLLGPSGATYTYARQKGAADHDLPLLENGMQNLYEVLMLYTGYQLSGMAGMGAAGGIGLCAYSLLGARLTPGSERISQLLGLEEQVSKSDVIITGEGRFDEQSLKGKITGLVLQLTEVHKKPTILICGSSDIDLPKKDLHVLSLNELCGPGTDPVKNVRTLMREAVTAAYSRVVSP